VLHATAEAALLSYDFPGNARELQNIVERAVVLAPTTDGELRFDFARGELNGSRPPPAPTPQDVTDSPPDVVPMTAIRDLERTNILNALTRCAFKVSGRSKPGTSRLNCEPEGARGVAKRNTIGCRSSFS
jgi:transcriptional regulator with GAF, ATPase, and Fis domain